MKTLPLTGLAFLAFHSVAQAEESSWRVLDQPSSYLVRAQMGNYSDDFGCGMAIIDVRSLQGFSTGCYDLGENIFLVHRTVNDTCDVIFPTIGSLPASLKIEGLPRCSEKEIPLEIRMAHKASEVLKKAYGIDLNKLR